MTDHGRSAERGYKLPYQLVGPAELPDARSRLRLRLYVRGCGVTCIPRILLRESADGTGYYLYQGLEISLREPGRSGSRVLMRSPPNRKPKRPGRYTDTYREIPSRAGLCNCITNCVSHCCMAAPSGRRDSRSTVPITVVRTRRRACRARFVSTFTHSEVGSPLPSSTCNPACLNT